MTWQYTPYIIPVFVSTLISLSIAILAWRRRNVAGATPLLFMMLSISEWLLFYIMEIGSTTLSGNIFWANLAYIGIVAIPIFWLLFSLEYTDSSKKIPRHIIALLFIEPVMILISMWTDNYHHLFREGISLETDGHFALLSFERGPLFWVHVAYSYFLIAYGTFLLVKAYIYTNNIYRAQIGISMLGAFVPWIINILYISPLAPIFIIDPTPIAFLITGLIFAWGIFGYRLMDISPVARNWVIEQMDDGMFVLDPHFRVVDINPAAQLLIGKETDQIIGLPVDDVFDEWSHLVAEYRDVKRANSEISFSNNGKMRYFNLRISPLYDKNNRGAGRLIVLHDNTDQRKVEIALRAAKESAEAANRAKSTFLANMSHELRTPLTAIIGYSELLQEQASMLGDQKFPNRLEKINISAEHLLSIINNLLDLSKVEAGQMDLNLSTFNIISVIESLQVMVQPELEKNQNELSIKVATDIDFMHADQAKVQQILLNLLHNAAKFTKNGDISLTAQINPENSSQVMFAVADSGIGMTETQVKQLFRPFFQADASTTRRFGGTGLGLAISYHLCKLMKGEIIVQSTPKEGSLFKVFLPISVDELQSNGQEINLELINKEIQK